MIIPLFGWVVDFMADINMYAHACLKSGVIQATSQLHSHHTPAARAAVKENEIGGKCKISWKRKGFWWSQNLRDRNEAERNGKRDEDFRNE